MEPIVRRTGPVNAELCIVEARLVRTARQAGFSDMATAVIDGTLEEYGQDPAKVATLSVCWQGSSVPAVRTRRVLADALAGAGHRLVVGLGPYALKALCRTTRTLDDYAGSLTWHESVGAWVLPSFHPNVLSDPMKAYRFDFLYDHLKRAAALLRGDMEFPPAGGHVIPWEWIGHNGEGWDPEAGDERAVWSGFFEYTDEEFWRQREILRGWLARLDGGEVVRFGLDTESFNTDFFQPLTMIQVYDGERAYAFNWGVVEQYKEPWKWFLEHPNARFDLSNTKHDRKMLRHWLNVDLGDRDEDTMVRAMGLTEKGKQCGLKYLSRQYCNAPFYEEGLDVWTGSDKKSKNYGHIRPDILAEYGCADVYFTYRLAPILRKLVEAEGTTNLVEKILLPAQRTLADIEYTGMLADVEYAKQQSAEWGPVIQDAIREVEEYARSVGFPRDPRITSGQAYRTVCDCVPVRARFHLEDVRVSSFGKRLRDAGFVLPDCKHCGNRRYIRQTDDTLNVSSWSQMQHLCYDILGMEESPNGRRCDKAFWQVNADHPFAKLVAQYRELHFLRRNFLDGIQQFVRQDGRVHPDFLLFGTKTGRLAVHDPPAQTLPTRSENARPVKKMFKATEGHVIVNADFKSLEMWVNAYLTGDPQLLDDLRSKDMYKATAMEMFQKTYEAVTDEERSAAKPVVLGSGYGIGAKKLAKQPGIREVVRGDTQLTRDFIDAFWQRYHVWRDTGEEWRAEVLDTGRLTTEFGRVRRWNLITPDNIWKVRNQAINFKGQSTASDICLTALVKLHWGLKDRGWGRVVLTVHDSLVFEIRREHVHEAVKLIRDVMGNPDLKNPFTFGVDVGVGDDYAEACSKEGTYDPEGNYT